MSALTLFTDQHTPSSDSLPSRLGLAGSLGCCVLWTTCFSSSYSVQAIPPMLYQGLALSLLQEGADYSLIALTDDPLSQKYDDKKEQLDRFVRIAVITAFSSAAIVILSRIIAWTPYLHRVSFMLPPLSQTYWKVALVETTIRLWQATMVAIHTDSTPKVEEEKTSNILTPKQIKELLDKYVIGQDNVKRWLGAAAHQHLMRKLVFSTGREPGFKKSNVLMLGPSGSGKTLLIEILAKIVKVPFIIADATTLTKEGYVGQSVTNIIQALLRAAGGDVKLAAWGIIYIDEIDKIKRDGISGETGDISGGSVQQELLTTIEGRLVDVNSNSKSNMRDLLSGKQTLVDTHNILFIVGGSFVGLDKIIRNHHRSSFENNHFNYCQTDGLIDGLIKFGMIPEFIGRFNCLLILQKLSIEDFIRILTEPKRAPVKDFQALFNEYNIELEFEERSLHAIAVKALSLKTGARSLITILEGILHNMIYEAPSDPTIKKIIVTEESVTDRDKLIVLRT